MKHTTIAVDVAKNVFEIAVSRCPGRVSEIHRLSRSRFLRFFAQQTPAHIVMEACGMAHFWARQLQKLGHSVVLLPPQYVSPTSVATRRTEPMPRGFSRLIATRTSAPCPSNPSSSKPLPPCTASARLGSLLAPLASTESEAFYESSVFLSL